MITEIFKQLDVRVAKAALPFRAYNNRYRRQLIRFLTTQEEPVTVSDIYRKLGWEQSVCSQHLKILRDSNLVTFVVNGKERYYSINQESFYKLLNYCKQLQEEFPALNIRN